jgi:hypothetical protein
MVEWQVVAAAICLIALILLSLIIFKLLPAALELPKAVFKSVCYDVLGCRGFSINPACLFCLGVR